MKHKINTGDSIELVKVGNQFRKINNLKSLFYLFICSVVIGFSGLTAYLLAVWWVYIAAFVMVAIAGDALLKLQHEAMHGMLVSNRKYNTWLGGLSSALMGTRFHDGTTIHMRHHARLGANDDPNLYWYDKNNDMLLFIIKQLLGAKLWMFISRTFIVLMHSIAPNHTGKLKTNTSLDSASVVINKSRGISDLLLLIVVQGSLFVVLTYFSSWWVYWVFILLPISTLGSFLETIRSFSEHVHNEDQTESLAASRRLYFVQSNVVERFILSQFGFHLHHLHHLHPTVPVFNLRSLHSWMLDNQVGYDKLFVARNSYTGTLGKYIFK